MRQQILIGVERRRRWSDEQKLSVLSEVGVDGASVVEVARRHDITRQHIYQWRSEMRRRCEAASSAPATFLPVQLADGGNSRPEDTPPDPAPDVALVEISLRNGRSIRAAATLPAPQLTRLIRIVETA
jgi:transposase